jgi:hypothetical protein
MLENSRNWVANFWVSQNANPSELQDADMSMENMVAPENTVAFTRRRDLVWHVRFHANGLVTQDVQPESSTRIILYLLARIVVEDKSVPTLVLETMSIWTLANSLLIPKQNTSRNAKQRKPNALDAPFKNVVTIKRLELFLSKRTVPQTRLHADQSIRMLADSFTLVRDVFVLVVAIELSSEVK